MNARITSTSFEAKLTGRTLNEIRRQMNSMLKVEGPRALTAVTDTGAKIHVELEDGQDYIEAAGGRITIR